MVRVGDCGWYVPESRREVMKSTDQILQVLSLVAGVLKSYGLCLDARQVSVPPAWESFFRVIT